MKGSNAQPKAFNHLGTRDCGIMIPYCDEASALLIDLCDLSNCHIILRGTFWGVSCKEPIPNLLPLEASPSIWQWKCQHGKGTVAGGQVTQGRFKVAEVVSTSKL
jgi:hypothetical protein